jgi:hypothetical protein
VGPAPGRIGFGRRAKSGFSRRGWNSRRRAGRGACGLLLGIQCQQKLGNLFFLGLLQNCGERLGGRRRRRTLEANGKGKRTGLDAVAIMHLDLALDFALIDKGATIPSKRTDKDSLIADHKRAVPRIYLGALGLEVAFRVPADQIRRTSHPNQGAFPPVGLEQRKV